MSRSKSYKSDKGKSDIASSKKRDTKKRPFSKREADLDARGRDNDPNYYFTNAELAAQAAQLSFQNVMGLNGIDLYKIPSICRVMLNPCPGLSYQMLGFRGNKGMQEVGYPTVLDDTKHGINLMSSKLYTMLSTFTGRTSQYAPQDVGMMILAISSVAELSEHIRRLFGIVLTYNPRNRNLPLGIMRTMGINVADFMAHIPEYRMRFNVSMTRINQLPLLDNIAFIRKSREIYQRVYMDNVSPMSQIFYYCPRSVWTLDESSDESGTVLKTTIITSDNATVGSLLTTLETMITALLESSTLNLIYADLLNMANKIKVPVWQFDYLAENYIVMPEYNANAILQFHHLRSIGSPKSFEGDLSGKHSVTKQYRVDPDNVNTKTPEMTITNANDVVCDVNKNNIVYNPAFTSRTYSKTIVDMENPDPTVEDKIEALRFSVAGSGAKIMGLEMGVLNDQVLFDILPSLPDHYCISIAVFDNVDYKVTSLSPVVNITNTVDYNTNFAYISSALDKFSHAPFIYGVDMGTDSFDTLWNLWGDLNFWTVVDYEYLRRVNELMYTGLFDFRV